MVWSDVIQGLILETECTLALDVKKMNYVLKTQKKHDDLLSIDPSNANKAEILSIDPQSNIDTHCKQIVSMTLVYVR